MICLISQCITIMSMISEKDLAILNLLRENARATVTEISKKVSLPRSTIYEKIKKLKHSGVIKKYSCLVNFNSLGMPIHVKVLFKVSATNKPAFGGALASAPNINNLIQLGNEYDYLASFIFPSMEYLHNFIDSLVVGYELTNYRILYIANELKREGFKPVLK